jgi:hypothetical protein
MAIHQGSGFFEKNRVSELKLVFVFPSRRDVRFRISGENFGLNEVIPQIWLPPLRSACGNYLLTSLYKKLEKDDCFRSNSIHVGSRSSEKVWCGQF